MEAVVETNNSRTIRHQVIFMPGPWHESRPTMPVSVKRREVADLQEIAYYPLRVRQITFRDVEEFVQTFPDGTTITTLVNPHNEQSFEVFWADNIHKRALEESKFAGLEVPVHPRLAGKLKVYAACTDEKLSL